MKKKIKTLTGCALCGASITLHAGLKVCSNKDCSHIHDQAYAFEPVYTRESVSKYPEYAPVAPKLVDEEMR